MLAYCWYSDRSPPEACNLARSGWNRVAAPLADEAGPPPDDCAIIVDSRHLGSARMLMLRAAPPATRARMLFAGVEASAERAALLAAGFGDAVAQGADLPEIEQRALRLLRNRAEAVLLRRAGPVLLDLAAREAWLVGRRLGLHPREFALLWRLAEAPGVPVARQRLLRDICQTATDPGTNRIAVHVCRLRAKLADAGLRGLVETTADGAYRLASPVASTVQTKSLDRAARLREHAAGRPMAMR